MCVCVCRTCVLRSDGPMAFAKMTEIMTMAKTSHEKGVKQRSTTATAEITEATKSTEGLENLEDRLRKTNVRTWALIPAPLMPLASEAEHPLDITSHTLQGSRL